MANQIVSYGVAFLVALTALLSPLLVVSDASVSANFPQKSDTSNFNSSLEEPAHTSFLPLVSYFNPKWRTSSGPTYITAGSDGNMWFLEYDRLVGKITPAGDVTEYRLPDWVTDTRDITAGPDGALWFVPFGHASLGRMTTGGVFSEFPLPDNFGFPAGLTVGPDGLLWFTSYASWRIGRLNADGTVTQFHVPDAAVLGSITTGPDGNLWFIESWNSSIGRLTPAGEVTHFRTPTWATGVYQDIAPDSAGYLWYTVAIYDIVGRVSLDGVFAEYEYYSPVGLEQASDGSMCVALASLNGCIRCITRSGAVVDLTLPENASPSYLATGPDGNLWITASGARRIVVLPPPTDSSQP